MSRKRPALGRGLGALLPTAAPKTPPTPSPPAAGDDARGAPKTVAIEQLAPNPEQPRKRFDDAALDELAASIRSQGIIQPIVVTRSQSEHTAETSYIIVAGERRWRAAQRAGLQHVPVVIRHVDERDRLELALIENIQRADLNPIEEARAFHQLVELRGYTQEALAERVGKDRSTVANALRLLRLPERVQDMVRDGRLSMGHARALLGLRHEKDMNALATEVVRGGLSVRATERAVRNRSAQASSGAATEQDEEARRRKIIVAELEDRLRRRLGARVRLRPKSGQKGAGTVEIPYASLDELDRLLRVILHRED